MVRNCLTDVPLTVMHIVPLPACCPFSGNPREGSQLRVAYRPNGIVMPVEDLEAMPREYVGGFGKIRGMEEMIQDIARRLQAVVGVKVRVGARLIIRPPFGGLDQKLDITARAG